MGRLQMQMVDADRDRRQTSFETTTPAADGSDYPAWLAAHNALRDAINAVTLGNIGAFAYNANDSGNLNPAIPTNLFAQTSTNWTVEYVVDGLPGVYTGSLPTADLSAGVVQNGRVELDLGAGDGATLKAALEAAMLIQAGVDAGGTGAVTVQAIYHRED